ncbi:MAG: TSUP family transporter [Candidatus Aenigmarchaeota archaeon]|nr:TSUP family transporter [Candidatus Aenigmarchaeota archaeon]NIP40851.1 TSUP family transporter [Candidatus Aenigmarchaeota archaeon]NIQ17965.1 TSUP family transporter [Candidatus Aenigmarchaeota archaeon]NIS73554.1 TSUP family transporter [Candidatus Aenigmarchaeota archaeon]
MDPVSILIVFVVGFVAASFGTLVGGGSLLTIPVLIFLGLPPRLAVATNRLGSFGGTATGLYKFHEKRLIDYRIGFVLGIPALIGAVIGASLVLQVNEILLRYVIGFMTILILLIVMVKPGMGLSKTKSLIKKHRYVVGGITGFLLGMYGGFYGAGSGTFFAYVLILLFGQTFLESAATRKVSMFFMSGMATLVFIISGVVVYSLGIPLLVGSVTGAYVGTHYADRIGNVWIKRLFFVVVLIMGVGLLV